ncbi:MAG TPA: hypothetical protein DCR93_18830 [Cytophagales bacterium]|nr:hypothetical protein [Cytophagales bacterium]HAP61460.1 hypothetical protein [Cytophagales bacterium]
MGAQAPRPVGRQSQPEPAYADQSWAHQHIKLPRFPKPGKLMHAAHLRELGTYHHTNYLLGPSAYMLPRSKRYIKSHYGPLVQFEQGLLDYASVGGGIELVSSIFLLMEGIFPMVFLQAKVGVPLAQNHAVATMARAGSVGEDGFLILTHTVYTIGNSNQNITFGANILLTSFSGFVSNWPSVSYLQKLTPRTYLLSENYLMGAQGQSSVMGLGLRHVQKRGVWDFGLITGPGIWSLGLPAAPMVSYLYKW